MHSMHSRHSTPLAHTHTPLCLPLPHWLVGMPRRILRVDWEVCSNVSTPVPDWYNPTGLVLGRGEWKERLRKMDGLVSVCTSERCGRQGSNCSLAIHINSWVASQHVFLIKWKTDKGWRSQSRSAGYVAVKAGAWGDNTRSFYLHKLICYARRGPPPSDSYVAHHLCHHKLCLNPEHIIWVTKKVDKQVSIVHKQRGDEEAVYDAMHVDM